MVTKSMMIGGGVVFMIGLFFGWLIVSKKRALYSDGLNLAKIVNHYSSQLGRKEAG